MPEKAKNLWMQDYKLVDLQSMPDEEIKKKQHLGMAEYFLKHIHMRDMLKLWDQFLQEFKEAVIIDQGQGYFYIKNFLWYTDHKVAEENQSKLEDLLAKHLNQSGKDEVMRSIAQKYIDEGIEKGIEKGRHEGMEEGIEKTALNMLKENVDVKFISRVTGLSSEEINKLKLSAGY